MKEHNIRIKGISVFKCNMFAISQADIVRHNPLDQKFEQAFAYSIKHSGDLIGEGFSLKDMHQIHKTILEIEDQLEKLEDKGLDYGEEYLTLSERQSGLLEELDIIQDQLIAPSTKAEESILLHLKWILDENGLFFKY